MADIRPFRGTRYQTSKVPRLSEAICPPYDQIAGQERYRYYLRSPFNAVRLELGQEHPEDTPQDNRHTRANQTFHEWLKDDVLRHDEFAGVYVHEHSFRGKKRTELLAALKLEDAGIVRPLQAPDEQRVADRLALLKAGHANFSPVLALYEDPDQMIAEILIEVADENPYAEFTDELGDEHRLWRIINTETMDRITEELAERPVYLGDGQSRYAAALAYRDHLNQYGADAEHGRHNYILAALVDVEDPGLCLEPVHRLIKTGPLSPDFKAHLARYFDLEARSVHPELPFPDQVETHLAQLDAEENRAPLAMLIGNELIFYVLRPKAEAAAQLRAKGASEAHSRLPAALLEQLILVDVLGIMSPEGEDGPRVAYARDHHEVLVGMGSGHFDLAFFLAPPAIHDLQAIADQGAVLPPNAVDLYPPVPAGLVFQHLEGTL